MYAVQVGQLDDHRALQRVIGHQPHDRARDEQQPARPSAAAGQVDGTDSHRDERPKGHHVVQRASGEKRGYGHAVTLRSTRSRPRIGSDHYLSTAGSV